MKLEAQTLAKIRSRINEKVMGCCGTWIDWQYLLDAAALLAKCRYTLQYTYPYAYYMEPSPRKELVSFNLNFEMGLKRGQPATLNVLTGTGRRLPLNCNFSPCTQLIHFNLGVLKLFLLNFDEKSLIWQLFN